MDYIVDIWNSVWGRVLCSIILAAFVFCVLTYLVPFFTRKTRSDTDDIIASVLRVPLPVVILLSILITIIPQANLSDMLTMITSKTTIVLLILSVAYLFLRLCTQVLSRCAERYAKQTETNLDDVLVPLLTQRIVPLFIIIIAVISILWAMGINLGGVLAGIGAISFLLIFLFQEPISNLFGGVYLVMDVPFKYGDLIILEDQKTYRVEEIGSRVTKLYDTDNHTVAYMPNRRLAAERIANLTRPNVELRMKMNIGVAYSTRNLQRVQEILVEAANANPHILGDINAKLSAIETRLSNSLDENSKVRLLMEMDRLRVEDSIRELCEKLIREINSLSDIVHHMEEGGLDRKERQLIQTALMSIWPVVGNIRIKLTVLLHLSARLDATYKLDGPIIGLNEAEIVTSLPSLDQVELWRKHVDLDEIKAELLKSGNMVVIGTLEDAGEEFSLTGSSSWIGVLKQLESHQEIRESMDRRLDNWMSEMPIWDTFNDYRMLYFAWHKPVHDLLRRLKACSELSHIHGEKEFLLHEELEKVISLLEEKFPLRTPGWQLPDADLVNFGESRIDFQLEFFIDDLGREHFQRVDDVYSELGMDILARLKAENIEIPFPQVGVSFRDEWLKGILQKHSE